MFLKHLYLQNFRNYSSQSVAFNAPKTILLGDNAQGKSNLLEAVELLATLKSHRTSRDRDLVREGERIAHIKAQLQKELAPSELNLVLRNGGRRATVLNGETLKRQQDFLGSLNAVQFSSLDIDLVRGGPGERRNWIDTLLTQLEPVYAYILQQYNQVLKQRNAFIKQHTDEENSWPLDATQMALWDAQLVAAGTRVIRRRSRGLQRLIPLAKSWHQAISGDTEQLTITYQPNISTDTPTVSVSTEEAPLLKDSLAEDSPEDKKHDDPDYIQQAFFEKIRSRAIAEYHQRTSLAGPHRDDIDFSINHTPARQYGSQGQQRTLVLALKLAELELIEAVIGEPPLLLLDDVLAELDLKRQNQLLETIEDRFQTLITTTHLGAFDAKWLKESQILTVHQGALLETG
ncbi:DNA replication/repair protein RecF [cf. Phormidesmis sp. LEGE 11477]|uniref:DNA replication/repair protein RecF n=1 Tax=cf. Phormidesmis sp. LEGE 11477 TaxID=1828680 RepID=UPI001882E719|nr:DNA replication/repair protein RecF [cf. Phormidesmis sp. LEGE 11477]MBE9064246.1 DNA replication/repair protein RecF [cf. Phormidesmis sp. LEGE 11477]